MMKKYLGEQFDIHTGSRDLMFPHHDNEIAISRAASGKPPARYWMHCESVLAADNDLHWKTAHITLEDAQNMGFTGREIRYWLIAGHYRKPVSFSKERVSKATAALERLDNCVRTLSVLQQKDSAVSGAAEEASRQAFEQLLYDIRQGFVDAMDDDLNLSAALASVFKNVKAVNAMIGQDAIDSDRARKMLDAFAGIDSVLKVFDFKPADRTRDPEVKDLIRKREQARREKNWELADRIREELRDMGVDVVDGKVE